MRSIILLLGTVLFLGCTTSLPENQTLVNDTTLNQTVNQTINQTIIEKELELPLHLQYKTYKQNNDDSITVLVDYWLESKTDCDGRIAYLGIMRYKEPNMQYGDNAKITIYNDDGTMAASDSVPESSLAFADAESSTFEYDLALFINTIYALGNKNFMTASVWNTTLPEIFQNITTRQRIADYSIFKIGESNEYILPCMKFKMAVKGPQIEGTYSFCVLNKTEYYLPIIVDANFSAGLEKWELVKYEKEPSGLVAYPQCLNIVKCSYVPWPNCGQDVMVESVTDENGCVTEYNCRTLEDSAESSLKNSMPNTCTLLPGLSKKLLDCYYVHNLNLGEDDFSYVRDNNTCITDVICNTPS